MMSTPAVTPPSSRHTPATQTPTTSAGKPVAPGSDKRSIHAATNVRGFALLTAQLVALVWAMRALQVEERAFINLMGVATGGFVVHYWIPFAHKERFWIALSLGGAALILGPVVTALLIAFGLGFYLLLASGLSYRAKVWAMTALALVLMAARGFEVAFIPVSVWPVLGALFMFRMMIYLYDLRQEKGRPSIQEFFAYFFPLPNFYFLLFPVVDLQTQRRTYFQRDIHAMAQQGLLWMARGAVQLLLYRVVYFLKPTFSPDEVVSFGTLVLAITGTYLLYLRVSGQFHIIVGLMHLFGYDLPETHRKYLLSSSLTDFWRRINIYWKDFMVKVFYFPVYFRLRRSGDTRARVLATVWVFVATWALHSYQWFWLRGEWLLTWTDSLFWAILGALVVVNLLMEQRTKSSTGSATTAARAVHGLKVAGTLSFIIVLWSFWQSPTIAEWTETVTWWDGR